MSVSAAIEDIEKNDSGKSMDEMFDDLGQEIIANAFSIIKRQKGGGPGLTDAEKKWQEDAQYQFNIIEKIFSKLRKNGRISVKANESFDKQLASKIKSDLNKNSTIGQIVQMIPQ